MYLTILILPLLGSFVSGFLGRKIGVTGSHIITCTCLILSSILATIAFYEVGLSLFTFFMLVLVSGANFFVMFVG
jgi:NADH-ubiquinone oxidoreductase chain 5